MSNPTGKGGFGERKHAINRKGRPKSFDALRALAQQIANEPSGDYTRIELRLRSWSLSPFPDLQLRFIEIAYGKVPDELHMQAEIKRIINWDDKPDGSD